MEFKAPIETKRIEKWDNLKALLIFTIVIGHMAGYYTDNSIDMRRVFLFIYIFHMPAFLFISGLFSKKNIDQKRYANIFSYLILFYVIKIILFVTKAIINGEAGTFNLLKEDGSAWYAFALFAFCFITMLVKKLDKKYAMTIVIILGCLVGFDPWFKDFLVLSRILVFYPFFLAGYYIKPKDLIEKLDKTYLKIIGWISFGVLALLVIKIDVLYNLRPLLTGRHSYSALEISTEYSALLRLLYYGSVFVLIFLLIAITPKKKTPFTICGRNSISIYAIHRCLIFFFFDGFGGKIILEKIYPSHQDWLILPIAFVITIALSPDIIAKGLHYIIKPKLASPIDAKN